MMIKSLLSRLLPDELYLKIQYRRTVGKKLNLDNPTTFNEKIQWLKLHDRKDIYTTMVDKYTAKKYVADIIGDEYIIPTFGVYNKFEEINFDELPEQFVIKCTHDSGGLVVVDDKNKLDINVARTKINTSLRRNFYYSGREWPYKNVKPRIIVEKYMHDSSANELRDYKFFCFNGLVKCFKIDFNRFVKHQANYYDTNGNLLKFGEIVCPPDFKKKLDMPINLSQMVKLAEKLAKGFPFLRVDFYEVNEKIFFGELTFYPASGMGKFKPEIWDRRLGDMINIKKENDE